MSLQNVSHDEAKFQSIHAMFNPRSVAIIGATEKAGYGGRLVENLIRTGSSARLYPVNPSRSEVFGLPCYSSIRDVPEPVDLVAIVVPSAHVVPAFRDAIACGAKSALIISAGFAELATEEGIARQAELRALARQSGVRLCGPNCLGLANVAANSWTTPSTRIAPDMQALRPRIGLVSQSGATAYRPLLGTALDRGIAFRYFIATGNEADLESSDFIHFMLRDPEVSAVAAVVEGFKNGAKFIAAADYALEVGKPIVLLKIGRTEAGARGAKSHTAAMTGSDVVQDALFRQKGVIRVDDYDELIEVSAMFNARRVPTGKRIGVISESGGMGSFMADKCAEEELEVPPLSPEVRSRLLEIMGERGSAENPADLTGFGTGPDFPRVLDTLLEEDQQDLVVMSSVGGAIQADTVIAAAQKTEKPILFVWTGSTRDGRDLEALRRLQASDVPVFYLPAKAARAARRLVGFHRLRQQVAEERNATCELKKTDLHMVRNLIDTAKGDVLDEHASKQALAAFGLSGVPEAVCVDHAAAQQAAQSMGYPVVLKIVSQQLPHKTEAGGVKLGITGPAALTAAYDEMMVSVKAYDPTAKIDGVLVQRMMSGGVETIVGISQDVLFGPVLMLGLGGVLAEAFEAATWRVCPVNRREAEEMVAEVRGLAKILDGFRGAPKADRAALVDALVNVSRLAMAVGEDIASLDINPLTVMTEGQGAIALDALLVRQDRSAEAAMPSAQRKAG